MPSPHTVRAAFEYYLSSSSLEKRTKQNIQVVQKKVESANLIDRELSDIKRADIRRFLEDLELTASTVQLTYTQLKSVLKTYVRDNNVMITLDVDGLIKRVPRKTEKQYEEQSLTFAQLKKLLTLELPAENPTLSTVRDLFCLSCFTGMALADITTFNPLIHMDDKWIEYRRAKRGKDCVVPLTPPAQELINKISWPVKISHRTIQLKTAELGAIFGKKLNFHMARHTAGTVFLELGMDMASVSKILGHASIKVTETVYAKVTKDKLSREMMKFPMEELKNITTKS